MRGMLEEQDVILFYQWPLLCPPFFEYSPKVPETTIFFFISNFFIQLSLNSLAGKDHRGLPDQIKRNHEVIPLQEINMYRMHLPHAVSAVNEQIIAGHVGASIADQVDVSTLQLLGLTIAAHGNHREPQVLSLLVDEVGQTGVNVSGGNAVHTGKVAPLVGKRPSHVDTAGLGDVVGGLLLGEVGDVARHGGCDDEATRATLLEVSTDSLGTVEGTRQIGLNDLFPVLHGAVENAAAGSTTGVGDESIDFAEFLDDVLDQVLDALPAAHITLVGLDLDTVLLLQLLGILFAALWSGRVGDGQVGAHLGAATSGLNAHATGARGTGDNHDLALKAQEVLQTIGLRNWDRHVD